MKVTGCGITQGGEGWLLGRKRVGGLGRCAISVKLQLTGWQGRGCAIIHNFSEFEKSCQTICAETLSEDFFLVEVTFPSRKHQYCGLRPLSGANTKFQIEKISLKTTFTGRGLLNRILKISKSSRQKIDNISLLVHTLIILHAWLLEPLPVFQK